MDDISLALPYPMPHRNLWEVKILIINVTQLVEEYFYNIFDVVFASGHRFSSEYHNIACFVSEFSTKNHFKAFYKKFQL